MNSRRGPGRGGVRCSYRKIDRVCERVRPAVPRAQAAAAAKAEAEAAERTAQAREVRPARVPPRSGRCDSADWGGVG